MSALESSPAGEYRAFLLMSELPAGSIAFPVTDERGWPHLRIGEFAVVDPSEREPISGEIYLMQSDSGRRSLVSLKAYPNTTMAPGPRKWWVGAPAYPWKKPGTPRRSRDELFALLARYGMCDGPMGEGPHLARMMAGRVVGVLG